MDTQNITPLTPQKDRQVSGWLSFFLFVVGLGAAITVVTSIADFSLDAYDIGVGDFFIYLVALIDIAFFGFKQSDSMNRRLMLRLSHYYFSL